MRAPRNGPRGSRGCSGPWRSGRICGLHESTLPARGSACAVTEDKVMKDIDAQTQLELEAAAFRRLLEHLRERTDVQNIDLMNLAGFCRNCLSNWLKEAADARGVPLTKDDSRTHVYGMPYEEWKERHQREATTSQLRD